MRAASVVRKASIWVGMVGLLLVSGCSGGGGTPTAISSTETTTIGDVSSPDDSAATAEPPTESTVTPTAPLTFEQWLSESIDPGLEQLLAAFAAVFGPVPGVEPLEFVPSDGSSRSALVGRVLARLGELAPEQQDAVTRLVAPDLVAEGPVGFAGPRATPLERELQTLVDGLVDELSGRLGWSYPHPPPVVHVVDRVDVEPDGTWAEALASQGGIVDLPGGRGLISLDQSGPTGSLRCVIYVGSRSRGAGTTVLREKMLHEVFHCFQYAFFDGDIHQFDAIGGWRVEGTAAWVGLEAAGGPTTGGSEWWRTYLQGNSGGSVPGAYALTEGWGYHAVGFWSFLAQRGVDVWQKVLPQLNAGTQSQAYAMVTGDDPTLLSQWGSSTTRLGWSGTWDMSGPQITGDRRVPAQHDLGLETVRVEVQNLQNRVDELKVTDPVEYALVSLSGIGTLSWGGDGERAMVNQIVRYCYLDDCLCPDGTPPFDGAPFETRSRATVTIGSGSLSTGPTVTQAVGLTKEDVCRPCEGSGGSASGFRGFSPAGGDECPDPCLEGKWLMDNAVLDEQFRRLTVDLPIVSAEVSGATVWDFNHGRLLVAYGHSILIVSTPNSDITVFQTEAYSGTITAGYQAVAGLFEGYNQASDAVVTSTVEISGQSNSTAVDLPADSGVGYDGTYTCSGNDLTLHFASLDVTAVLHRITPTD